MKKTFTLIEMLIVIVIIGILAAALIPRLQSVQWRARDTKRKADFNQIGNALSIYSLDNGRYPWVPAWTTWSVYSNSLAYGASWIIGITWYITSIPWDPLNVGGHPWDWVSNSTYSYGYLWKQWKTYALFWTLETTTDQDRCWYQNYKRPNSDTTTQSCSSGSLSRMYVKSDLWP